VSALPHALGRALTTRPPVAGTLDLLAFELGRMLAPLRQRLAAGDLAALFQELGLPLPDRVRNDPAVTTASSAAVTALDAVPAKVTALATAVTGGDEDRIASAAADLVGVAGQAFTKAGALASAIRTAYTSAPGELSPILSQLPERLLGYVIVSYLEGYHPVLARTLTLLGVVDAKPVPPQDPRPAYVERAVRFDRLGALLDDPAAVALDLYRWNHASQPLDAALLLGHVRRLLLVIGQLATLETVAGQPELRAWMFTIHPGTGTPTPLELGLRLSTLTGDRLLPLASKVWQARLQGSGSLAVNAVRIRPPGTLEAVNPTGTVDGEVTLSIERPGPGGQGILLFGQPTGTRLTAHGLRAAAGARFTATAEGPRGDLIVEAEAKQGALVVSLASADSFLGRFLPTSTTITFDVAARWTQADGLTLRGGAGLALAVPLTVRIGPIGLDRLDLAFQVGATLTVQGRLTGGLELGPLSATVDGIGAAASFAFKQGNLGPVDLTLRFLPPRGLGLELEAGPLEGGGFIAYDEATGRYSGVLRLQAGTIGLTALGLLDTRLPGGRPGFAMLAILQGRFPPIQVGFGIALTGVGGLIGLNRRLDVDALRQRFASGAAGRILDPEDPIRNAPVLLTELDATFPVHEGSTIVGPTLQMTWIDLVKVDLGLFLELPGPTRVALLGSARAVIANPSGGKPYLQIRLDILGVLDFNKRTLEFDAVLVDSQLLGLFELTGGAAFRLSWGHEPYIVLTVGGFHPSYDPAPLTFPPSLTRVALTRGKRSDVLYLRFEAYFAITTNTLQFGAALEVVVNAGPFTAEGFLGFDALIRFTPFYFEFSFRASLRISAFGITLAGVRVAGKLSGPGPVTFTGTISIEILFFEISWSGTITIGSKTPPAIATVPRALGPLGEELRDPANLEGGGSSDPRVRLAPPGPGTTLPVLAPSGRLVWSQKRAPLGLLLQRFENAPLERQEAITASGPQVTGQVSDWFAPGSFAELGDSDALNQRAFQRLQAGVQLGADGVVASNGVTHTVGVKQYRIPATSPTPAASFAYLAWLLAAMNRRDGHEGVPWSPKLKVKQERWRVVRRDGSQLASNVSEAQAHQLARARNAVAVHHGDTLDGVNI
jgi:hypothetical protein